MHRFWIPGVKTTLLLLLLLAVPLDPVSAEIFTPTRPDDSFSGLCTRATCNLRGAIKAANRRPGADVVFLSADVFVLSAEGAGEDAGVTGDLDITDDLAIIGAGAGRTIIDGGAIDRILDVHPGVRLDLASLTLRNGSLPVGSVGGALNSRGFLVLQDVVITQNHVEGFGGGLAFSGEAVLRRTTVWGNQAQGGGGGIFVGGDLEMVNSTVSGNESVLDFGGGIYVVSDSSVNLKNSTVAENRSHEAGGGILVEGGARFFLSNSLLAGNQSDTRGPDCAGTVSSSVRNLVQDGSSCTGLDPVEDLIGVDPLLGPLNLSTNNLPVHALLPGSPAIDAGDNGGVGFGSSCETRDQRGVFRNEDLGCDIGAFEVSGGCVADARTLCLKGDRFQVRARFSPRVGPAPGALLAAKASPRSEATGAFWFFQEDNEELFVKVLDGCSNGTGSYWVFLGGLTNLGTRIDVVDLQSGEAKTYQSLAGTPFQPILDTKAFQTCP